VSNNVLFGKCYDAAGPINANSIVKVGTADYAVLQADGPTTAAKIIGVTTEIASSTGERIDVVLQGIVDLKLGGTVARGDLITSDVNGNGVTAAPSAGTNNRIVGIAIISGVVGDLIPVFLAQGLIQG
jgi:hypothetical protein